MRDFEIDGEGGGKAGGSGGAGATEASNTLQSKATAKFVDLLCEGEIEGLVDGAKSIFFDKVPIQNPDDSYNFQGFVYKFLPGAPDQTFLEGFPDISSEFSVNKRVRADTSVEYITETAGLTSVTVTLQLSSLAKQDKKTGDLNGSSVQIAIDVKDNNNPMNAFVERVSDYIDGKQTSTYERSYTIMLEGVGPYLIRMRRITPDNDNDVSIQDKTYFARVTETLDHKISYSDSAVVGISLNSEQFGNSIPERTYLYKGRKVRYPSNYDPVNRVYDGFWDGTWNYGYCNNPAWVFMDIATEKRAGAGVDDQYVDKWGLYDLAQYADELVPDLNGGMEPRFAFNGSITTQEDAYKVLQGIASMMRAIVFYSAGAIIVRQDRPLSDPRLFTASNIKGMFNYASTAKKARHTAAIVQFLNPALGYDRDFAVYEDPEAIARYGYNPIRFAAYGTTSMGQAFRLGKWAVVTDLLQTDSVQFVTGIEGADLLPGDLIEIADTMWATADFGGRVENATANVITLDREIDFDDATSPEIHLTLINGPLDDNANYDNEDKPIRKQITYFTSAVSAYNPSTRQVTLVTPIPAERISGETPIVWIFSKEELKPRPFKVISVTEQEKMEFKVLAIKYVDQKFDIVDEDASLGDEGPFTDLPDTSKCEPPTNLVTTPSTTYVNGVLKGAARLSWDRSPDKYLRGYLVSYKRNNENWVNLPLVTTTTIDILDLPLGYYWFELRAANRFGTPSSKLSSSIRLNPGDATDAELVYGVESSLGNTTFTGRDCAITWHSYPLSKVNLGTLVTGRVLRPESDTPPTLTVDMGVPTVPVVTLVGTFAVGDQIEINLGTDQFDYVVPLGGTSRTAIAAAIAALIDAHDDYIAASSLSVITLGFVEGSNLAQEIEGEFDPYFKTYKIEVRNNATNAVLRTEYTKEHTYTYTFEKNMADTGDAPRRNVKFAISVIDTSDHESLKTIATISNAAPALLTPTIVVNLTSIILRFARPKDPDYEGIIVWMGPHLFTPSNANRVWKDAGNPTIPAPAKQTAFIRYAFYDAFGETELNISDEVAIDVEGITAADLIQELYDVIFVGETLIDNTGALIRATFTQAQTDVKLAIQRLKDRAWMDALVHMPDGIRVATAITHETETRISEDEALITQIDGIGVAVDDAIAAIETEQTVRAAADLAEATARTLLYAQVTADITAAVLTESTARATADSAEATQRSIVAANLATASALIDTYNTASISRDNVISTAVQLLGAVNGTNTAFVLNMSTAQVSAGVSLGTRLSGIDTAVGSNSSAIVNEQNARISADSGLASSITSLSVTVGGFSANITQLFSITSDFGAKAALALDVNGNIIGWELVNDGMSSSYFSLVAPNIRFVDPGNGNPKIPFSYSAGLLRMHDVEVDTLAANTVTADKVLANNLDETTRGINDYDVTVAGSFVNIGEHNMTVSNGYVDINVWLNIRNGGGGSQHVQYYMEVWKSGSLVYTSRRWGHYCVDGAGGAYNSTTFTDRFKPGAGTYNFKCYAMRSAGGSSMTKDACTYTITDKKTQV